MKTRHNIGEEVLVKCKVKEIHISANGEVLYMVAPVKPRYLYVDDDTPFVAEDQVAEYLALEFGAKIPIR